MDRVDSFGFAVILALVASAVVVAQLSRLLRIMVLYSYRILYGMVEGVLAKL